MFQFNPVVRTLSDLAKTIRGKLETKRFKKSSGLGYYWVSRIVGPHYHEIGHRPSHRSGLSLERPCSERHNTALAARQNLARKLSRTTFVVRDWINYESTLALGRIRP